MELLFYPQVVAKYLGFQQARGASPGYLSTMAQELKTTLDFVKHEWCPKHRSYASEYVASVATWWDRLSTKLRAEAKAAPKPNYTDKPITLWDAWVDIDLKWEAFVDGLEVGVLGRNRRLCIV